ncbi:hypothetical protein RMSM_01571 [Rhodopirellula maiorica SM1]|uniref:Uncharacterized protein n=1 Tax=Rhodopirellula maiorica SM1 TaxID=1265738 RepID=M5RQ80_9BACT|nr:hypothetical protein RMSM_01571 [Rhodopirellula maiorica SM1]
MRRIGHNFLVKSQKSEIASEKQGNRQPIGMPTITRRSAETLGVFASLRRRIPRQSTRFRISVTRRHKRSRSLDYDSGART